ncbi:MAG TPA: glycosyltransferase [Anaerolineae bacterium]|nr:glycosyltransferase [Anaerolineae bacterium]
MKFSIVIPTYNRSETLRQTLIAVTRQDYAECEVLVVDDGSTDGTAEIVAREFPAVRLIRQSNRGPAAARNAGVRAAVGDIIAFTDDDCLPPLDWLTRLAEGYARYPQVAGVGGYLEAPEYVLRDSILAQYERSIGRDEYGARDAEVLAGFACPAGGTNNMSYCRDVLEQVGGFDETFPYAAGEDADLKWRICQTGAQLLYLPIKVVHLQVYSLTSFRRQAYMRGKGRVCFDAKHGPHPTRLRASLRLMRRLLHFPFDLLSAQRRPYAPVGALEGWLQFRGEWDMLASKRR